MSIPMWIRGLHEKASRVARRVTLGIGVLTLAAAPPDSGEARVPVKRIPELVPDVEVKKLGGRYVLRRAKAALQVVFAQHRSHSSHASHRSHASHYSSSAAPSPVPSPSPPPQPVPDSARTLVPANDARLPAVVLIETFDDSGPSAEKWRSGVLLHPASAADSKVLLRQANGRLHIKPRELADGPHFNGYISRGKFDARNGSLFIEAIEVPNDGASATIAVAHDMANWYGFTASGNDLRCVTVIAGRRSEKQVRYDAKQRYWRLRIIDGGAVWETSADTVTWSTLCRESAPSAPSPLGDAVVVIEAGSEKSSDFPGLAVFDDLVLATR